jgi:hypothetical protein
MFLSRNRLGHILLLTLSGTQLWAQTSGSGGSNPRNGRDNNPYSKYGMGELMNGNTPALKSMGGISSVWTSNYAINTENPATYAFFENKRAVFDIAAVGSSRTTHGAINGVPTSSTSGTATINHMAFAVPVSKRAGFTLGFRPYAHTYYSLQDSIGFGSNPPSPVGNAKKFYGGEGGMNFAFLGGAFRYKGLSIGANAGYLFGNVNNTTLFVPQNDSLIFRSQSSQYSTQTRTGGIYWKSGVLYETKLDSSMKLRIGGTFNVAQNIKQHYTEYHISQHRYTDTLIRDTAFFTDNVRGNVTMPMSYSIGIMLHSDNKWGIGIDYSATRWSDFSSSVNGAWGKNIASTSWRAAIGMEYTPDINDFRHILSRSMWRLGGYTGTEYITPLSSNLNYFGFTAGTSMPLRRFQSQVSYIHAGFDYRILGTTDNGLMKQNSLRFTLGVTMTARWFDRPKYQ